MNAAIEPEWAERLAGPLAKRTYSEPRWERKQGAAVADEKVTLFGVPIVVTVVGDRLSKSAAPWTRRPVLAGAANAQIARHLPRPIR